MSITAVSKRNCCCCTAGEALIRQHRLGLESPLIIGSTINPPAHRTTVARQPPFFFKTDVTICVDCNVTLTSLVRKCRFFFSSGHSNVLTMTFVSLTVELLTACEDESSS